MGARSHPAADQGPKRLAARAGKKKRDITVTVVPDDILEEAKRLAGDRIINALLTTGKLAREAACKAIQDEVGAKLVEKFGAAESRTSLSTTPSITSRRKPSAA